MMDYNKMLRLQTDIKELKAKLGMNLMRKGNVKIEISILDTRVKMLRVTCLNDIN
jgi:hypothetical protein